jgi:hypothetical protein
MLTVRPNLEELELKMKVTDDKTIEGLEVVTLTKAIMSKRIIQMLDKEIVEEAPLVKEEDLAIKETTDRTIRIDRIKEDKRGLIKNLKVKAEEDRMIEEDNKKMRMTKTILLMTVKTF